jgi:hypothetical protein
VMVVVSDGGKNLSTSGPFVLARAHLAAGSADRPQVPANREIMDTLHRTKYSVGSDIQV